MRILVDMDAILADLLTPWLTAYNRDYQDDLTVERILDWDIHQFTKPECGLKMYDYVQKAGLFASLDPLPGAIEGFKRLQEHHDVFVLTASPSSPTAAGDKLSWCKQHLGLGKKDVLIAHHKEFVKADVLIDDSPENIRAYRREWPQAEILTIAYPSNVNVDNLCRRFPDWRYPADAWKMMVDFVNEETCRRKCAGWAA